MRIVLVLLLAAAMSCTAAEPAPDPRPSPSPPPSEVSGLITELTYDGDQLASFVVESEESSFEILIDPEHEYGFNLKHLEQHRDKELPVLVTIDVRDDGLYAVEINDA